MHRPRTAWIFAVALAAACLSSPPALKADTASPGPIDPDNPPDRRVAITPINPFGDSDQYNHNPASHSSRNPGVVPVAPPAQPGIPVPSRGFARWLRNSGIQAHWQLARSIVSALFGFTAD